MEGSEIDSVGPRLVYLDGNVTKVMSGHLVDRRVMPCVLVVHAARGDVRVSCEGGRSTVVKQGGGLIIGAERRHTLQFVGSRGGVSRWAHFRLLTHHGIDLSTHIPAIYPVSRKDAVAMGDCCAALAQLHASAEHAGRRPSNRVDAMAPMRSAADHLAAAATLAAHVVRLAWPVGSPAPAPLFNAPRLAPVFAYVEANLAGPIARDDLADLVHLSPTRFHDVFKDAMGLAPMAWLKQQRLRRARLMLSTTDIPIAEVGHAVGYADAFHFSRTFKAATGRSPSAYRAMMRSTWQLGQ